MDTKFEPAPSLYSPNKASDNFSIHKLEEEMRTIKDLLKQQANPSKNLQQLLDDVEDKENTSQNSDSKPDHHSVKDFIHHEQSDLKKLLKRYEEDKRRYK